MPLASTSAVQVRYIEETAFGTIPVAGNPLEVRITGESLSYDVSKTPSAEINSSRSISSMAPTSATSGGDLNGELQYREYDRFMEATLQSTFSAYGTNGVGTSFTADFAATTITASVAPTTTSAFTNLKKGQWFRLTTGGINNGKLFRVSSTVAPTSTVITLDAGTPATVGTSVATCVVQTRRLTHGATQKSYTIEKHMTDIGVFMAFTGQTASKMSVSIQSGSLSTINFSFMGKLASATTTTQLPGTPTASYAFDVQSGVSGTSCQVWEGGAPLTSTFVKSISFDFDNALRAQDALCTLGSVAIGSGTINLTGSMSMYFADKTIFDKFVANTNTSLVFSTMDSSGNGYVFSMPVVNISSYKVTAGGKDADMMADVQFTALRDAANADATLQKVLFVDAFGSPAL
jgi:Phage tail tube protein